MTQEEALAFGGRIIDFLRSCGGWYGEKVTALTEWAVFYCIGSGQYVIREVDGEIRWFACFWKIQPEDVEGMTERVRPVDLSGGSVMYVAEAGNMDGRKGITEMTRALREMGKGMKGVFWHRPAKEDQVMKFPSQRGVEVNDGRE